MGGTTSVLRLLASSLACSAVALASTAGAVTVTVDLTGGGDFTAIQDAIDAVGYGDTVLVVAGTYHEHLYIGPSANGVTLLSESGAEQTVVTGDSLFSDPVLRCEDVGPATLVRGFTIRAGNTSEPGAGIQCLRASPVVRENVVTACWSRAQGGGISTRIGNPRIESNTITGNRATDGGGVSIADGNVLLLGNRIEGNTAAGFGGSMHGGGIWIEGGTHTLSSNSISGNTGTNGGGGVAAKYAVGTTFEDNAIEQNNSPRGGGLYLSDSELVLTGNVITGNSSSLSGSALYLSDSAGGTSQVGAWDNVLFGNVCASDGAIVVRNGADLSFGASYLSNNSLYELALADAPQPDTLDFTGNWWGVAGSTLIADRIWDCWDDPGLGACVDYSGWCVDPSCGGQATSVPEPAVPEGATWGRIKSMYR